MVAPSPRTRRPAPRPQPRTRPPSAGRRPPPSYAYRPPPRHGGRRLLVLVLLVATLGAVGYLFLGRGGSSSAATGFLGAEQQSVKAATTVVTAAHEVQRFAALHSFDLVATAQTEVLSRQLASLQSIASNSTGRQQQIANQAVSADQQAIDAVGRYRKAVAFTYRLADADAALRDLVDAVASLNQQAQAWQHA